MRITFTNEDGEDLSALRELDSQLARVGENLPAVPSAALDLAQAIAAAGDPLSPDVAHSLRLLVAELVARYPYKVTR